MTETPDAAETSEDVVSAEDRDRIARRAELLPEEAAAGSENPEEQAAEILHESDERTHHPEETGRESTQTSSPEDRGER